MNKEYNAGLTMFVLVLMAVCVAYMRHIKQSFILDGNAFEQVGVMKTSDNNQGDIYIPIYRKLK